MTKRARVITISCVAVLRIIGLVFALAMTVFSTRAQQVRACSDDIFPGAGLHHSVKKRICTCEYEYMEYFKLAAVFWSCHFVVVQRLCPIKWKANLSAGLACDGCGFA